MHLGFEEDQAGSLRIGKRGDLVVLSENLFHIATEAIKEVRVEMTISRGRITYRS